MGGTDTRTLKAAITSVEGKTGADIQLSADTGAPTIQQAIQQVGTANATTIPMAEGSQTTVAQKINAMDNVTASNTSAITNLQNKTAETILVKTGSTETIEDALDARVKTVNGVHPDSNGNAEVTTVPLAENLISELSQLNTDTFAFRTAGGETSIDNGSAWLLSVRGNSVHTGYSAMSLTMTVTETGEEGHMSATLDQDEFLETVTESGTTTMTYNGEEWISSATVVDPAEYGITITGTPVSGDTIVIVYVAEVRGTITPATPTKMTATGWNLYNHSGGYARVKKYSELYGYGISGSYTALKYSATYSGTRSDITVTSGSFTIPADGYVWVTGGDSTTTAIWATWSDWTSGYEGNFAAYAESVVDFSGVMTTYFPNGLLKAGSSADEINLNIAQAISRVERMAYSASNLAAAEESGREYEYDSDYIYLARAEAVISSLTDVDGGYTSNDHGMEWFNGTDIPVSSNILYGNNLKNKLERDVVQLHASSQTINSGSASTQIVLGCSTANNTATVRADDEGGNFQVKKGSNMAEFDSQPLNDAGTGHARIFVKTGSDDGKVFRLNQDGSFEDANGFTTAWLENNAVTDLNNVGEVMNGIKYFSFLNTASNKPKSYGGAGIYIGNQNYGVELVFSNSSSGATLSYRSVSGLDGTASWSAWKDITAS